MLTLHHTPKSKDERGRMKDEERINEGSISSFILPRSSLDADHLFDLSDDFNQVFLVFHHGFD